MSDSATPEFMTEVAEQIVEAVNLEIPARDILPDAPLFGENGLGLDSIDILEIALAVSKQYGCQLRSDDANNAKIFASLRNLADFIAKQRSK